MTNLKYHAEVLVTGLGLMALVLVALAAFMGCLYMVIYMFVNHETVMGAITAVSFTLFVAYNVGRDFIDRGDE